MKPILCVVDLTDSCYKVLEVAATVASSTRAHLIVLFTYRLIDLERIKDTTRFRGVMEERAKEKFVKFEKEILMNKDFSYEFQIEIGFLSDRINSYIARDAAGMVIIGEKQASAIEENRSVSLQHFIKNTNRPFIIVPQLKSVEAVS